MIMMMMKMIGGDVHCAYIHVYVAKSNKFDVAH